MSPFTLRTAFGLACMCTVGALVLLLLEPRGSAPFWITVWTLLIALTFLATVIVVIRSVFRQSTGKGGDI